MASGPERVQAALAALGLETQVVRVPGSAKTAQLAAEAVGCDVGAIVKSLVFVVDGQPVVVLCAGDRRVDAAKLAALRGAESAAMAPAAVVREATGYAIGGVPPLGHATALPVYLDAALLRWPVVYAAAGAPDALFPIESATLLTVTGAAVVDVSEA
jgi:Cys-tRNA(Pro) deacylase